MGKRFLVNSLTLNIDKTNSQIQLKTLPRQNKTFLIHFQNNSIKESTNTKFLGLEVDKHIN
jgi:hypothetical protein